MCVAGFLVRAQTGSLPTDFYIVSEVVSDASPFWFHYILHVTAAGRDSLVTYIRVAPLDAMCSESISVQAATVTLSGVQPADLISAYHICEIDSPLLNRKLQRRIHTAAIDDSLRFGIVASCEGREVVIHLPFPEQVRLEDLRKKSPQLARWWDLPESIKQRAFGSSDVFHPVSAEQDDRLQEEGGAAIAALRLGRFDQGLGFSCRSVSGPCKPRSFADELRGYVGTLRSQEDAPKLSHAAQYRFQRYVDPKYPPLARQARIQGTVNLDLSVDPSTGRVQKVNIVQGHPIFREAVMFAVRQWQFEPDGFGGNSQNVPAEVVFEFRCPKPIEQ